MKRLQLICLSCLMVSFFIPACRETGQTELSSSERRLADSLYSIQRDSIDIILDSLCLARYDSIYKEMYDRIMEKRLENIRKLYPDESK